MRGGELGGRLGGRCGLLRSLGARFDGFRREGGKHSDGVSQSFWFTGSISSVIKT